MKTDSYAWCTLASLISIAMTVDYFNYTNTSPSNRCLNFHLTVAVWGEEGSGRQSGGRGRGDLVLTST